MADLLPETEMEDKVDVKYGKRPIIEKAASDQLARKRVKVDRYSQPPRPPSMGG